MPRAARNFGIVVLCVLAVMFAGCGKKDTGQAPQSAKQAPAPQGPAAEQVPDMAKLAEENRQALKEANKGKDVQAVSGDTLKALLPADLPGMKRTDASSERTQMMGMDMSKAEGQYSPESGEGNINITITDVGNMSGTMRMGMAAWAMGQYSRETDNGYEKTITYKGYRGAEKYDKSSKDGNVQILVADRFIVEVEGSSVTMDAIKQALDKIDLGKLAASGS